MRPVDFHATVKCWEANHLQGFRDARGNVLFKLLFSLISMSSNQSTFSMPSRKSCPSGMQYPFWALQSRRFSRACQCLLKAKPTHTLSEKNIEKPMRRIRCQSKHPGCKDCQTLKVLKVIGLKVEHL